MIRNTLQKNLTIFLNVLNDTNEKIYPAYVSKHNSNCEKTSYSFNNYYKRRKTAFSCGKKLSPSLRGIASKNNADFFCLNCLHYFRTKETRIT